MEKRFAKPSNIDIKPKRRRKVLTLHEKMTILKKIEQGRRYSSVAREYDINESSVRTIKKNENKIKTSVSMLADCTSVKTTCLSRRDIIMEQMEHLLSVWIDEQTNNNVPITSNMIRDQARDIYNRLKAQKPHSENMETSFCASKGWFDKFRKRANLQNICIVSECPPSEVGEGRENYKRITCWARIPQDELLSQQRSDLHTEIEKIINLSNMIGNEKISDETEQADVSDHGISDEKELKKETDQEDLESEEMDEDTVDFEEENSRELVEEKEQEDKTETKYKGVLEILKAANHLKEKILQEDHDLGRSDRVRKEIDDIMKCYALTYDGKHKKTEFMDSVKISVPDSDDSLS